MLNLLLMRPLSRELMFLPTGPPSCKGSICKEDQTGFWCMKRSSLKYFIAGETNILRPAEFESPRVESAGTNVSLSKVGGNRVAGVRYG